MPSITWDSSFEALPADVDEAKYGATKIRQLKLAISERLELEMNFKAGTQPLLKAGKAAVIFIGTTAEITALSGMATGSFAWDTTLKVLKYYSGAAWTIQDVDHGQLSGLADDDHTQYLKLTKAGQEITENLAVTASKTIDGRDLSVDGTKLDLYPATPTTAWLGAWASKSEDTIYLAATDGFVMASEASDASYEGVRLIGYTDSSNPPTTLRCVIGAFGGNVNDAASFTMPVKKGDYWKVAKSAVSGTPTITVWWIPLGS